MPRPRGHRGYCSKCGGYGHRAPQCERRFVDGRALCECHDLPMVRNGKTPCGTQIWRCSVRSRSSQRLYWQTHFRLSAAGTKLGTYPATPEQRSRIAAFRASQRAESLS